MRRVPGKGRSSMVKAALAAVMAVGAAGLLGAGTAKADAKLVNAANAAPVKDAVQVFRGTYDMTFDQADSEVPLLQTAQAPAVPTYNLVNAGNGWLLDRENGRIINCYRIDSGYVGRRNIRCIAVDMNDVTY